MAREFHKINGKSTNYHSAHPAACDSKSHQNGPIMRVSIPLIIILCNNIITTTSAIDWSWRINNKVVLSPSSCSNIPCSFSRTVRKTADLDSIVFLHGGSSSTDDNSHTNSIEKEEDCNEAGETESANEKCLDRGGNSTAVLQRPEHIDVISGGNITVHHLYNTEKQQQVPSDGTSSTSASENSEKDSSNGNKPAKQPKKRRLFLKKKDRVIDPTSSAATYSKKLKNRNSLNIRRKFTHASFGFLFAALNHLIPRHKFIRGMFVLTSSTLFMEMVRYRKGFGWMNDILHYILGSVLRKNEMEGKFTGSLYYFLGVTCTAALFPKTAATMGIFQLAIADPSASYFGRKTRHIYWSRIDKGFYGLGRNKGILGFLGGGLACVPLNYHILRIANWGTGGIPGGQLSLITAALGLGLAGAFADLAVPTPALTLPHKICGIPVPPFHVDDNVVVPVVSGFACMKIFQLLGWSSQLELAKYILV